MDAIKIVKSLADWGVLIDGVTEAVKHKIKLKKNKKVDFCLSPLAALVLETLVSSVVKFITGKSVMRALVGYNNMDKNC